MNPKLPPQDLEAERSVLGALMLDKQAVIKVADILAPQDFYNPHHGMIFDTILQLFEKAQPIDLLSVTHVLKEKNALVSVGGSSYLTDLINSVPSASHVAHYAQIVREKRVLRALVHAASDITERVFQPGGETEDLLDDIEQKIFSISQQSRPRNFVAVKDELQSAYERIEALHQGKGQLRGVPTGFPGLDHYLSGLQKSDLIILGARPSLGKTSLCLDIARYAATQSQLPVGIFSLEMSRDQIIDRLISSAAQVPLWKLRTGRLNDEMEFAMIRQALDDLSRAPIYVDDTPSPNIIQLRSMARRLKVEHGLGLLVVDYLQLIQPRHYTDNMVQGITEVSRGLKTLARELEVPILAAAQLSREVEKRDIKIPRLSDLRETGAIEQDSDVVMFIYRKDRDKLDPTPEEQNTAEIIIAKHRNGPLGTVELKFDAERASFKTIDKVHTDPLAGF